IRLSTDTIAPAQINLTLGTIGQTSVVLQWTATGDDGYTGIANKYQVRYSINPIHESNWLQAAIVSGVPVPKSAGTAQQMTVQNLLSSTGYYFAIKASDEVPNWSEISNIVAATTLVPSTATLKWRNKPNFMTDGLRTEIGTCGMNIVYQVSYSDKDGKPPALGYPKVGIYREDGSPAGTYTMLYASGSYSSGAVYTFSMLFDQPGTYSYQFDGGNVMGDAHLCMKNGPIMLESLPDHQATNVTDTSFTVSWSTLHAGSASVVYGIQGSNMNTTATDPSVDDIHQITVDGLRRQTTYCYDLINNGVRDNNQRTIITGSSIIPSENDLIYGRVYKQGGTQSASGAITYAMIRDGDGNPSSGVSAIGSTRVDATDTWSMELANFRDVSLLGTFSYSAGDDYLHIWINGAADGVASQILMTDEDTPVCSLELCHDHIPPATITDLAIQTSTTTSITLKWTATGDDGISGKASWYHIRYGTSSSRVVDWGISAPLVAGSQTSFAINRLAPASTYYFIIQGSDDVWNTSAPSQTIMGTTAPLPQNPPKLSIAKPPLTPGTANVYTRFTYNVKYTDVDGDPPLPGEPRVVICQGDRIIKTCSMNRIGVSATYTYSTLLPEAGTYSYRFEATNATTLTGNGPLVFDIPKHLRITNVTDTEFTVSWRTESIGTSSVSYGTTTTLGSTATDDVPRDVHYVVVRSLEPDTVYYFSVTGSGITDDNQGKYYLVKTGVPITNTSPGSNLVYGYVHEYRNIPAQGAVVYVTIKDGDGKGSPDESAPISVLTDAEGRWYVYLYMFNARTRDYLTQFEYSGNDTIYIEADGGERGKGSRLIIPNDPPTDIILHTWMGSRDKLLVKNMTYSYPNPAKQTNVITFRYYLNADADITLSIYNLAGELIHRIKGRGIGYNDTNELVWDISDVASDIYIWRLEAISGELHDAVIKKLVIIK
ncbi:MAG: fibronectin type III domain-containing protein, partial [bacterium]